MRKHLFVFAVAFMALCIAMPAVAAVEFKYGGQFRVKAQFGDNMFDGTDSKGFYNNYGSASFTGTYNSDDNRRFIDQRLRLYFTFIGSPNLKVVTKFEMGDTVWGDTYNTSRTGPSSGGNVGADATSVEVKNAYVEFNIPGTPSTGIVGIQTLTLLDSWIVDDDFSAAVLVTKLDPFRVTLGYVAGQYGADRTNTTFAYSSSDYNVDSFFLALDYNCAPWKASLVFFWQDAHRSNVSLDPNTLVTPVSSYVGTGTQFFNPTTGLIDSNNLFDLGFNITYKVDWLLAYVNFVKNFGGVDFKGGTGPGFVGTTFPSAATKTSVDYTGFMVDAGVTYFCPPYTVNVGGFYTSGPSFSNDPYVNGSSTAGLPFPGTTSNDVEWFTYPLATTKFFSEIMGGGVLENGLSWYPVRGNKQGVNAGSVGSHTTGFDTMYWRGWGFPTNLWTITAGGSWQICPGSKLSASYWYFGTAEDVPVAFTTTAGTQYKMSSSIGHEFNLYFDQEIVDGLTLTLVGAYLVADDAFAPLPYVSGLNATTKPTTGTNAYGDGTVVKAQYLTPQASDAYKFGARLQWNF